MPFQNTVRAEMAFGIPGELATSGPMRVAAWKIRSKKPNRIGYAYTYLSDGIAQVGGKGLFVGVLIHPKHYASCGTAEGPLAPTFDIQNEGTGELLTMGEIIISLDCAAEVGHIVTYDTTTGALSAVAAGGEIPTGKAQIPNAVVSRYSSTEAGLAVVTLTN